MTPPTTLLLIAGALQNLRASTRAQTKREGWWQMDLLACREDTCNGGVEAYDRRSSPASPCRFF